MGSSTALKIKKIRKQILRTNRGQIMIHTSPDGDAVASAAAFYRVIRNLASRSFHLFCPKPIPRRYKFITHSSRFRTRPIKSPLTIVLDTASLSRLPGWDPGGFIINIDHHDSNPNFGDINIVDPKSSSTVEILMGIFDEWHIEIDAVTANILYSGIFTETGGFVFLNTKASSLINASRLVRLGASPSNISQKIKGQTANRLTLLGLALSSLRIRDNIALAAVTTEMFRRAKASIEDTEGFVEIPLAIAGVKISILLKELKDGRTKVSLRSKGKINVNRIALHFSGGGHQNAAGFIIDKSIKITEKLVLKRIRS